VFCVSIKRASDVKLFRNSVKFIKGVQRAQEREGTSLPSALNRWMAIAMIV
jgi:hypothetical protein